MIQIQITIENVCTPPIRFGGARTSPKYRQGEVVVVFGKRYDQKKTSFSDHKLTRALPAMSFHTTEVYASELELSTPWKRQKAHQIAHPDSFEETYRYFQNLSLTFTTRIQPVTWHDSVDTRAANDDRWQERWPGSTKRSSAVIALARTQTVGDRLGGFSVTWHVTSERVGRLKLP